MRKIACLILPLAIALPALAQDVFSNQTNVALQKVIQDYPNHFRNIKGDRLSQQQAESYKSKIEIPGAVNCVVKEHSAQKNTCSWTCELTTAVDFENARTQFREAYNQIRNTIVKMEGERPFILNGRYEAPRDSSSKFTRILFELLPAPPGMQQLKVELVMEYSGTWKITLQVYDQKENEVQALTGK